MRCLNFMGTSLKESLIRKDSPSRLEKSANAQVFGWSNEKSPLGSFFIFRSRNIRIFPGYVHTQEWFRRFFRTSGTSGIFLGQQMTIPGKKKQAHIVSVFSFPNSFPNLYSQHFYSILFVLKSAGEKFTLLLFYDRSCECNCSFLRSIFRMKDLIKKDKKTV